MNMVERVARALHANFVANWPGAVETPWDELDEQGRALGMSQARAAIAAMRVPSVSMTFAAWRNRRVMPEGSDPWEDNGDFSNMIDAALTEAVSRVTS